MGYQFNPLTGNLDLVGGGGGNPFNQDLNTTDAPTFTGEYITGSGKFAITSPNESYGQIQVINPNEGEASVILANNAYGAGGPITSNSGTDHVWAFGVGTFGVDASHFTIGNLTNSAVFDCDPNGNLEIAGSFTAVDISATGNVTAQGTVNGTNIGTAAAKSVPTSGNATSTQVVLGSDTRLTDSRTPTAHTHPLSALTQSSATTGQVATWNGTTWAAATPASSTDASALTSGTLADARLSSNVTLLTSAQTLTNKTLTTPNVGNGSTNAILTAYTANILSVANSTTACGFSIFNTRTDASNYEAGIFDFTTNANSLTIGTTKAGTGTARRVRINSAEQIDFYCTDTSRMFQVSTSAVTAFNAFGFQWFSSASDPTTSSTPFSNGSSYCAVYKNTTSGIVSLWVRDGSTMKKIALV